MNEQRGDQSQWVPYTPPPPSRKERVWITIRRFAFPVLLLVVILGLGALLWWMPSSTQKGFDLGQIASQDPAGSGSSARTGGAEGGAEIGTGYATLSVITRPSGATVFVDGDSVGTTPLDAHTLRSGVYIVSVEKEGYTSADTVLVLRNDEAPLFSSRLRPRSKLLGPSPGGEPSSSVAQRQSTEASSNRRSTASRQQTTQERSQATQATAQESSSAGQERRNSGTPSQTTATGTLDVISNPTGTQVELDGDPVGTTPLTLDGVPAGTHQVTFVREGYNTLRMQFELGRDERRTVQGALTPRMGRLRVLVQPWGSIYIDGTLHERDTDVWFETQLSVGTHQVMVVHPSLGRKTQEVRVSAGEVRSLVINLRSTSSSSSRTEPDTLRGGPSSETPSR